jgi:hypothetical protein
MNWFIFSILTALFESMKDVFSKKSLKNIDDYIVSWSYRGSSSAAASWGHVNPFYEFSTSSIVWQRRRNRSKQQRGSRNSYFILASIADLYGLH